MDFLLEFLKSTPEYTRIYEAIDKKRLPAAFSGFTHILKVVMIAAYTKMTGKKATIITADEGECQRLLEDFLALSLKPVIFTSRDFTFRDISVYSKEYEHKRLNTLSSILDGDFDVILTTIDAASQITIPKEKLIKSSRKLSLGDTVEVDTLKASLISSGYTLADMVDGWGQFSVRGGIVDIFPPSYNAPLRIELFGDEVDRLTILDVTTGRSVKNINTISISPAKEAYFENKLEFLDGLLKLAETENLTDLQKEKIKSDIEKTNNDISIPLDRYLPLVYGKVTTLFDYIEDTTLFLSESLNVTQKINAYFWQTNEDIEKLLEDGFISSSQSKITLESSEIQEIFERLGVVFLESFPRTSYDLKIKATENFTFSQTTSFASSTESLADDLMARNKRDIYVILAGTEKAAKILNTELNEYDVPSVFLKDIENLKEGITVTVGNLSRGFEIPSVKLHVISKGTLRETAPKKKARPKNTKAFNSLEELVKGDYVVHSAHGIGVFEGIVSLSPEGIKKDYIKIKYQNESALYVPVTQLDLVSKYIGPREDGKVKLHKLGGSEWSRTRSKVKRAVKDMAEQLTKLYAKRMAAKGYAFSPDTDLQSDFESRFIYEETEDQLRTIREIKGDMESAVPMDRLLCGDVGFGKTEVALRAAFKCVADGKQCAILVPTTILAWQHYNTARERIGVLPVNVEMLSRFRTKRQQTDIIRRVSSGEVDILVGTHRLISKDVKFRDLGLVIVDEEQRFGVAQKEKLKELFPNIDVLTLTATPIPRTLNMAMTGLRDMSVIEEAPQDRHPVQSYVLEQENGILYEAIAKELRRGGQVYYLHNRVESIDAVAVRLKLQFPDYTVATAHGKMDEETLSNVWKKLIDHEIDILVCTTIIETGVDVPNANTLIIEDADRMGLSQLHQLRGRVGRSSRRAYAYFCFRRGKALSEIAQKRLRAIREYTEFGSGFKIAMRDLEIRGAGSILGGEQHGHMEAVGYDMYLKLLTQAVEEEKGTEIKRIEEECLVDLSVPAFIPESYIASPSARIGIYRRIADITEETDKADVIDELIDRFGEPPKSVLTLIDLSFLRHRAALCGIKEISEQSGNMRVFFSNIMSETVSTLCEELKGRASINIGNKPYVLVKKQNASSMDTLKEILDAITT